MTDSDELIRLNKELEKERHQNRLLSNRLEADENDIDRLAILIDELKISLIKIKESGGSKGTSGDGHAECIEIATSMLDKHFEG